MSIVAPRGQTFRFRSSRVLDAPMPDRLLRDHVGELPRPHAEAPWRWDWRTTIADRLELPEYNSVATALAYCAGHLYRLQSARHGLFDVAEFQRRLPLQDGKIGVRDGLATWFRQGYGLLGRDWEADAPNQQPRAFYRLRRLDEVMHAIRWLGPVVLGIDWYAGWGVDRHNPGVLSTPMFRLDEEGEEVDQPMGGIALCAYGYDARNRMFSLVTPFGRTWGRLGVARLAYHELERQLTKPKPDQGADAWAIDYGMRDGRI